MTDAASLPTPTMDEHSAPYWAALAERRILTQTCAHCGKHRFPRLPACPYCATPGGIDVEVSGTGTVYSFVRVHKALTAAFNDQVPYAVATVALDGGGRILGRLFPPEAAAMGLAVGPDFLDHDGWTELIFRPS